MTTSTCATQIPSTTADLGAPNTTGSTIVAGTTTSDSGGATASTASSAASSGLQSCPNPYALPLDFNALPQTSLTNNNQDNCYANQVANELALLGAANVNVFKLLGVKEQTKLIDLVGQGRPISGGDAIGYSKENAFNTYASEWRSYQRGTTDVLTSAYIGYDFGPLKLNNGRERDGLYDNEDTAIKHDVATISIKQGANDNQRATRVRVERSNDALKWFGAALVDLPDNCDLVTLSFNRSVPSRYWRVRPVAFNGGATDVWAVSALQLIDAAAINITAIEDRVFLENRNRDYSTTSIQLKATYQIADVATDINMFGIDLPQQLTFEFPFSMSVAALGRPIVIGDVFEVPSEAQYDPFMNKIAKYVEVTDVGWSVSGYTPGWVPTILRVNTAPLYASQETQDIVGSLSREFDDIGLSSIDDGSNPIFQDYSTIEQTIAAKETIIAPERGADAADFYQFSLDQLQTAAAKGFDLNKLNVNRKGLYIECALPPNGLPYTEGEALPTVANDGDYHRLTYIGTAEDIPPRLFKYSLSKGRWVYMETDRRRASNPTKPLLQEFLGSPARRTARDTN